MDYGVIYGYANKSQNLTNELTVDCAAISLRSSVDLSDESYLVDSSLWENVYVTSSNFDSGETYND